MDKFVSIIEKIGLVSLIIWITSPFVVKAQIITGINAGTISHEDIVVISGNNFGAKAQGAPLIWDDFEEGANGSTVGNGWKHQRKSDWPKYTDVKKYGQGNLSLTNHVERGNGCEFCGAYQEVEPGKELYFSYQYRFDVTGNDYAILKHGRLTSTPNYGGVDHYRGVGTLKYQYQPHVVWGYVNLEYTSGGNIQQNCSPVRRGLWHRVEMYYKLSNPAGEKNGEAWFVVDLESDSRFFMKDSMTLEAGYDLNLHSVLLPLMAANPREDGKFDLYVDNVYVDNTKARVEIGNASTWSSCTKREIQVPAVWSDNEITFNVNQGEFQNGESAFLFVVDENGNASDGYPITFNAGTTDSPLIQESLSNKLTITYNSSYDTYTFLVNQDLVSTSAQKKLMIYDISGTLIEQLTINNGETVWNCNNAKNGIYLYKLVEGNRYFSDGKLVLSR